MNTGGEKFRCCNVAGSAGSVLDTRQMCLCCVGGERARRMESNRTERTANIPMRRGSSSRMRCVDGLGARDQASSKVVGTCRYYYYCVGKHAAARHSKNGGKTGTKMLPFFSHISENHFDDALMTAQKYKASCVSCQHFDHA